MDKINFVNGGQPAINDTNLNALQDNVENSINALSSNVTLVELWRGTITATTNQTKTLTVDCSGYDIIVYRVRSDYGHYQNVVRIVEDNDVPYQVLLYSSDGYNAAGTIKYIRSTKVIEVKCEGTKGWGDISLERIYGIKLNKTVETTSE